MLFRSKILQEIHLKQYIKLSEVLNKTPTCKDVNLHAKGNFICTANTLKKIFGSMKILQEMANLEINKTNYAIKTNDEMIEDLKTLYIKIGRVPNQNDIIKSEITLGANTYCAHFGSIFNALLKCGFTKEEICCRVKITPNGTKCYSKLEYLFARALENNNIKFEKDVKYKDLIKDFNKRYTCDFVINLNNSKYLVEVFGIIGDKTYDEKTKVKIQLCEDNNLKLIQIYPQLLCSSKQSEIISYIMEQTI